MRLVRSLTILMSVFAVLLSVSEAQDPGARGQRGGGQRGGGAPEAARGAAPQRGGGQRGNPPIAQMMLSSSGFASGAMMPLKYTQVGDEVSPPFTWSGAPEGTASFVLLMRDLNAPTGDGIATDIVHWLLWNIPGTSSGLPEGVPQGFQLPDGTRQISVSGPYYRGPGAPSAGPVHHYVFELYALDQMLNVNQTSQAPGIPVVNMTRSNILQAMAGRVRGKAVYVGLFRRPE